MGIVHSQENGLSDLEIKLSQVIDKKIYNDWKSKTNLEHLNTASFISSKIIEYLSK